MDLRAVVLLASTLALSCAPAGDDPRSRLTEVGPESGEYVVRYLDPPWEVASASGTTTSLRVRSNAMIAGGLDSGPGKYDLTVSVEAGAADVLVAREVTAATGRGETVTIPARPVTTREGVGGFEMMSVTSPAGDRSFRAVFLTLDERRVVRLAFEAIPSLDTREVNAMIELVSVAGDL